MSRPQEGAGAAPYPPRIGDLLLLRAGSGACLPCAGEQKPAMGQRTRPDGCLRPDDERIMMLLRILGCAALAAAQRGIGVFYSSKPVPCWSSGLTDKTDAGFCGPAAGFALRRVL